MAFLSLEQLKSKVWETRNDLVADMKKGGFKPEAVSYRPAQSENGSWYIEEIDPDASQEVTTTPQKAAPMRKAREPHVKKPARGKAKALADDAEADDTTAQVLAKTMQMVWPDPSTANKWLIAHPQPGLEVFFNPDHPTRPGYCLRPKGAPDAKGTPTPAPKPETPAKPATKPAPAAKAASTPKPAKPDRKPGKSSDPSPDELPKGFDDWLVEQATRKEGVLRTEIKAKLGFERRWMNYLADLGKQRGHVATMVREGRFTRFFMK